MIVQVYYYDDCGSRICDCVYNINTIPELIDAIDNFCHIEGFDFLYEIAIIEEDKEDEIEL